MKKTLSIILLAVMLVTMLSGCGSKETFAVKEIKDYFYEAGPYTSLDYDYVNKYFRENNDNWGGGCSAVSAVIGGTRLVGRNMDLNISEKCAYVVRTKVPKKYETVGLAYTFRKMSPDLEELKKNGMSEEWQKILPFMCDDVMNSQGLHVELNMRHGEQDANGNDVFGVEHTNPGAAERVYVFNLGQYLALNCKDLAEVKKYLAEKVDVYSQKDYWNYCYIVTDAKGNSELLEFGHGKYYWTEPDKNGVVAQTNFYVNEECNKLEEIKTGLGRYETLMNDIGSVKNKADLYNLMKKVQFSSYYLPYAECMAEHFDPRSEVIGEEEWITYDFVFDPANAAFVEETLDYINGQYAPMSRKEKQSLNELWESTFTEVVDTKAKTIDLRLFEDESYLYQISLNGIKEISEIR